MMRTKSLLFSTLLALLVARAAVASPISSGVALLANAAEGEPKAGLLELNLASIIWVLVIFLVLLGILYKTAWKNVLAGLKAREERIRKDIADAELAREKAEASLKEYQAQLATAEEKGREMLSAASAGGGRIATTIKMQAQQEAEAAK